MEKLSPGEKKEWISCSLDPHLMRTGSQDLWDAIFVCFAKYRNAPVDEKEEFKQDHGAICTEKESSEFLPSFREKLYQQYKEQEDTNTKIFFQLLSLRFLELELFPYLQGWVQENTPTLEEFQQEVVDKTLLLAEHRLRKKAKGIEFSDVEESLRSVLQILLEPSSSSFDLSEALLPVAQKIRHHILCLSPNEEVLFDTLSELSDQTFTDTIIILNIEKDEFESIGRYSFTREGTKKLSRIFSIEDPLLLKCRKHLNTDTT